MLVLSRKDGQELRLGDDVVLRVLKITSTVVKLGIIAPTNVKVVRGELPPLERDDENEV